MKKFIESMENVKSGEFTVNGEKWTVVKKANGKNDEGTSPKGLWLYMTNGKEFKTIYKKDILDIDRNKAIALFN
jgi:hypothetical protein